MNFWPFWPSNALRWQCSQRGRGCSCRSLSRLPGQTIRVVLRRCDRIPSRLFGTDPNAALERARTRASFHTPRRYPMSTILKSFAELAEALDLDELPDQETAHEAGLASLMTDGSDGAPDLQELLTELQSASATLAIITRRDQEARDVALRDLERYDEIVARQREAERAHEQALHLRD